MKVGLLAVPLLLFSIQGSAAEGDAALGARAFRVCTACHSLEANRNMTGPSLANILNRKAGTLPSFSRYSQAMKNSNVVWDEKSLDAYLKSPGQFIPGNHMSFPGVPDIAARQGIIAFLKDSQQSAPSQQAQAPMGHMPGMGQRSVPKLKSADASSRVKSITYCRDTFRVTTVDGNTRDFWERNLRFKTDSSDEGPQKNSPAILSAGMMGDRASVIFAAPEEISRFITTQC